MHEKQLELYLTPSLGVKNNLTDGTNPIVSMDVVCLWGGVAVITVVVDGLLLFVSRLL